MLQKYVPFPPGNQAGIHTGSIPFGDPETLPGVGGVLARLLENSLTTFFSFLLVLNLFKVLQRVSNGYFKENYYFPRFQRGSNIFQGGGVQLFSGGSKCYTFLKKPIKFVFIWSQYPTSGPVHVSYGPKFWAGPPAIGENALRPSGCYMYISTFYVKF